MSDYVSHAYGRYVHSVDDPCIVAAAWRTPECKPGFPDGPRAIDMAATAGVDDLPPPPRPGMWPALRAFLNALARR